MVVDLEGNRELGEEMELKVHYKGFLLHVNDLKNSVAIYSAISNRFLCCAKIKFTFIGSDMRGWF